MLATRLLARIKKVWAAQGFSGVVRRGTRKIRRAFSARLDELGRQRAWTTLVESAKTGPVFFPRHDEPVVSIVIPVHNDVALTSRCLNSILRELDSLACEVIVIDDASTDGTAAYLGSCSGIRVLTHPERRGRTVSMNDGASTARGRFLCFLDNATLVTPHWLQALLRTFDLRQGVAAVGGQIRNPDGTVFSAGGIVWRDGQVKNYGRGYHASNNRVNFPREVDYCSDVGLMIRTGVFRKLGGFRCEYEPGSLEYVDLCFKVRDAGYRVMYQPTSVVVQFQAARASSDAQEMSRELFVARWKDDLAVHLPPDERLIHRAARRATGRSILVIDAFIPFEDRSAGARRLFSLMRLMSDLGWHVMFLSDDGAEYEPYTSRVRRHGIEVLAHQGNAAAVIRSLPAAPAIVWVSRPDMIQKYLGALRVCTTASIIYDTVDLHYVRLLRQEAVTGKSTMWEAMHAIELDLAGKVDHVVVTSEPEQALLRDEGIEATVVPIVEKSVEMPSSFAARRDVLFLGNYSHEPNVDAVTWLVNEIMPLVWARMPDVRVILAGADPTASVERLASERVVVPGYQEDLRSVFDQARVFVAPLRFGGGMKGKVVQSIANALPIITTGIGAEGIGLIDGLNAVIRDDGPSFAEALMWVYNDESLWRRLSNEGLIAAQRYSPASVHSSLRTALMIALEHKLIVGVDSRLSTHAS